VSPTELVARIGSSRRRSGQKQSGPAGSGQVGGPAGPATEPPRQHFRRRALRRFLVGSAAALLILAVGTALVGSRVAKQQALREARYQAEILAQNVAAPLVNAGVRSGDPKALARINTAMSERLRDGSIVHIKLWDEDSRVLWSDESALVGNTYALDPDDRELFGTHRATADVSSLNKAENVLEHRKDSKLLEVYAGATDADGRPLLFEAYLSLDQLRHDQRVIIAGVLPVGIIGLLLFQIAVVPMAFQLARRVERHEVERSKVMRHALVASELERQRLAQELHDGVIQDMAGICFALPTIEQHLPDSPDGLEARGTVRSITDLVQKDATALRSLLLNLYPPNLAGEGFAMAADDIARSAADHGVAVTIDIPPAFRLPLDAATLAYRVVREGVRNVVKHANARTAAVAVREDAGTVHVTISDDGRGPGRPGEIEAGHLGLQLLRDTVADFGGELDLVPGTGSGAVLRASFPKNLVDA
jgi:signal transduction histidine kinase